MYVFLYPILLCVNYRAEHQKINILHHISSSPRFSTELLVIPNIKVNLRRCMKQVNTIPSTYYDVAGKPNILTLCFQRFFYSLIKIIVKDKILGRRNNNIEQERREKSVHTKRKSNIKT